MSVTSIIFDCDGTLVDSEGIGVDVIVELAAEHGAQLDRDVEARELRGLKLAECVSGIEARSGVALPDTFIPEIRVRTAAAFRQRLQAMPGIHELLSSLRVPYCVASSAPREKTELSLSLTGLLRFFEGRIFSSYEVGSWKPEPGLFLHAAQTMGFTPESCAVIEDSEPGVAAGLAAGMQVFAFGFTPDARPQAESVRVVRDHFELRAALAAEPPA